MEERLRELEAEARAALEGIDGPEALEQVRLRFLGKRGLLTQVLRSINTLPPGERPRLGRLANELRVRLQEELAERAAAIRRTELEARLREERIDVTLPGATLLTGRRHPLMRVLEEIED
ncbi:MAG: phenylalanine--tRNA ligase subunit alpha, partial [Firmicutes bacterium]|nr:phenylalanine--tRNA ligase subunit alpha [Bacillota bacterium]